MTGSPASSPSLVAVIGAGGGIGSALTRHLVARGDRVLAGSRRESSLEALADLDGVTRRSVDATDPGAVEAFLAEAAEVDAPLRAVVCCAGSVLLKPAHLTSPDELHDVLSTNLATAFWTVRAASRALRGEGGSIVLVSSAAASIGLPNHEAIAAAKGGVAALARSAAATYAAAGIRVNAVAPGLVRTPATRRIVENDGALQASLSLHPLGRVGEPEDIAALIGWLVGPDSSFVTGQVIESDGGLARLKTLRR